MMDIVRMLIMTMVVVMTRVMMVMLMMMMVGYTGHGYDVADYDGEHGVADGGDWYDCT